MRRAQRGVAFSPAGLLTPFHLGASHCLQTLGLLDTRTALSGTSGGALAAVFSALSAHIRSQGPDSPTALQLKGMIESAKRDLMLEISAKGLGEDVTALSLAATVYVGQQCRDHGTRKTLRTALEKVLNTFLPDNIHEILNDRPADCTVGFTVLENRTAHSQTVSRYLSKQDVIECLSASCNVPWYYNGNDLTVRVRDTHAIDGAFSVHPYRFGCPETFALEEELLVTPFPASRFRLFFNKEGLHKHQCALDPHAQCRHHIISPDFVLRDKTIWPFSIMELFEMSLTTPRSSKSLFRRNTTDEELKEKYHLLFRAGEESVLRWNATR